jgi:enoyl-CoA hydratase
MRTNVELAIDAGVGRLTLAAEDPAKPATLDQDVLDALDGAMDRIEAAGDVRAVVVATASEKYFVVGANIAALKTLSAETMPHWAHRGHEVFNRLAAMPVPTVARVCGYCLGGGLELAMACDLIVASTGSQFGLPEARLGFVTGWGGAARLRRRVGVGEARKLLLTGRRIDAETARRIGLVDELAEPDGIDEVIDGLVADIGQCAPTALREMKRLVNSGLAAADARYLDLERRASIVCVDDAETRRRIDEFLNKKR